MELLLQLMVDGWGVNVNFENKKIKFIVIGTGNISSTYWVAVKNIEDAEIVAFVSRSNNRPLFLDDNFQIEIANSIKEVNTHFDAVIICTPNGLHHQFAIEAAELNKHVLTEKPLDITSDSMNKMIDKCRERNVKLGVAYQRRLCGDNPIVKDLIEKNKLGKIFAVNLSVNNYRDGSYYNNSDYRGRYLIDGGGPFIQQASHYVDLYGWYFGKPNKIVSKLDTFIHKIESEDFGVAICVHPDGMIGTITASTATKPGYSAKLEIYSENGSIFMENDLITKWSIENIENPSKLTVKNSHSGSSNHLVSDTTSHERVIKDFISAINNDTEPFINGESARIATEIVLDIYNNQI